MVDVLEASCIWPEIEGSGGPDAVCEGAFTGGVVFEQCLEVLRIVLV